MVIIDTLTIVGLITALALTVGMVMVFNIKG